MYEIDTSAFKLICFFYMRIFIYNFIVLCGNVRACLETHLSIMKRFNSMLAMAI